ncbi:hypothetical protein [Marinobacter changyiensis]|uniref:hypothetical protein n=1 Tax=Marinobacter changyiensis TaxID=2604091 RepID=UPI0012659A00|nr:hypothetical protein [Marinobacter changyiensis]
MKKLILICGLALLVAAIISIVSRPVPIEQKLIQVHATDVLEDFPAIEEEPVEVQAALLDLADDPVMMLKAKAAFLRHPEMARVIFPLYGAEPEFQDILRRYGDNILPPIHHFVSRPIGSIELMNNVAQRYRAAKEFFNETPEDSGTRAPNQPGELSPEERGWYAVNFIQSEGHDFLGQFIVDAQGDTQWVGTERVLEGLNQFFASGVRNLEVNYRSGEEITAGDIGWASVDVLVFASALKVLRMGRAAAATTKGASRGTRSAAFAARVTHSGRMVLNSARYAKWPVIIGAGYLVIAHPSLINDALAGIADVLGYPAWAIQFLGWLLILIPVLYIGSWLLWLIAPIVMAFLRSVIFLVAWLSGRSRRSSG